jgi:hypothetical protein
MVYLYALTGHEGEGLCPKIPLGLWSLDLLLLLFMYFIFITYGLKILVKNKYLHLQV